MKSFVWEKLKNESTGFDCFKCKKAGVIWKRICRTSYPGQGEKEDEFDISYCCQKCAEGG